MKLKIIKINKVNCQDVVLALLNSEPVIFKSGKVVEEKRCGKCDFSFLLLFTM
jgi:hypothetical protein